MTDSTLNAQAATPTKYCPACRTHHPVTDFDVARSGHRDGLQGYCRRAMVARVCRWRWKQAEGRTLQQLQDTIGPRRELLERRLIELRAKLAGG